MKRGGSVSGAISLVMIFCVLCLAVFATLTLVTANRESTLANLAAERAADYYAADSEAARVVAALCAGETPEVPVQLSDTAEGRVASFALPAGGEQELRVQVALTPDGGYRVLRWTTSYAGSWEVNEGIDIWDGEISAE